MAKPHAMELRERAVKFVLAGESRSGQVRSGRGSLKFGSVLNPHVAAVAVFHVAWPRP
jgi:hypothetical protein